MSIFNDYFQKLESVYLEEFNALPTVTYTEDAKKCLLVGSVNEDEEIQWRAVQQDKNVEWDKLEKVFGFAINDELKEYYGSFYFFHITGSVSDIYMRLYPVGATKDVDRDIRQHFTDGKYDFPSTQIFLIGEATVDLDDSYFVYYNNETKEVFCYDREVKKKFVIANSLSTLFSVIKAEY